MELRYAVFLCIGFGCQKVAHSLVPVDCTKPSLFCDFGRKLVNLSLPVPVQCFAAMDGSKSLNAPWTGHLRRTRHFIAT